MKYRLMILIIVFGSMMGVIGRAMASQAPAMAAPRIVGGSIVTPNSLPWQALLQIGGYMCGGSLIDEEWVLTASHCVEGMTAGQATVYLGLHDRQSLSISANPYLQTKSVSQIIMHASYNPSTTDYDVALLKLATPATLTQGVQMIPLATTASNSALYTAGTMLTVSGWGTTSSGGSVSRYLQKVSVPVVSNTTCNTMYGGGITARMLCAGDTVNGGEDSCQGDSGGPLIGQQNGNWVQVGVVSWGIGCASAAYPGVYTHVANLYSWIAERVNLDDTPPVTSTVPTANKTQTAVALRATKLAAKAATAQAKVFFRQTSVAQKQTARALVVAKRATKAALARTARASVKETAMSARATKIAQRAATANARIIYRQQTATAKVSQP
jgi:trypsin